MAEKFHIPTPAEVARMTPAQKQWYVDYYNKIEKQAREVIPIVFFKPNPPQYRLAKVIGESYDYESKLQKHTQFGAFWGNGTGKSYGLMAIIANIIWGPQNEFFGFPLFKQWPFKKHIRLVVTADELKAGGEFLTAIETWWPKHRYKAEKLGLDYLSSFEFMDDGGNKLEWRMTVRTMDQDPKLHESAGLGMVGFVEPPPRHLYNAYPARFREGGFRVVCGTLLFESSWMTEAFENNPLAWHEFASDEENCSTCASLMTPHGELKGYLSHEAIQQRAADYSEEERATRRTGKPIHLRGSYFEVTPEIHFVPRSSLPVETTNYLVVDPHPNRPWAVVVGAINGAGDYYILDEWPTLGDFSGKPYHHIESDKRGLDDYAAILRGLAEKWSVVENIIDGKFANSPLRVLSSTTTLRDQLIELGLFFADGNPQVVEDGGGIRRMQQLLGWNKDKPMDALNRPHFYIADDLHNCKLSIRNLRRKKSKSPDGFIYRDAPDEVFLDFSRCMMYLVMHRAAYSPMPVTTEHDSAVTKFRKRLAMRGDLGLLDEREEVVVEPG